MKVLSKVVDQLIAKAAPKATGAASSMRNTCKPSACGIPGGWLPSNNSGRHLCC